MYNTVLKFRGVFKDYQNPPYIHILYTEKHWWSVIGLLIYKFVILLVYFCIDNVKHTRVTNNALNLILLWTAVIKV